MTPIALIKVPNSSDSRPDSILFIDPRAERPTNNNKTFETK